MAQVRKVLYFGFCVSSLTVINGLTELFLAALKRKVNFQIMLCAAAITTSLSSRFCQTQRKRRVVRRPRRFWIKPGRTDQWWCNMINGYCLPEDWRKNFRMDRASFMKLVDELRPYISPSPRSPRAGISAEKKVAITLYFLKDSGTLIMTANTFGVAISTVSTTVRTVCSALQIHLGPRYINLPQTMESLEESIAAWEQKTGFPMVVGAVDGTHIPIMQPYKNSQEFFSYKMKYTLNVQGVCNSKGHFIDVDIRWPGGTHDAKVFAYSSVNEILKKQVQPYLCRTLLPGREKVGLLLLGDPAYPLLPHVMKEYAHCTDNAQVIYNQMLRDARNVIECSYGRLKARWKILTMPINFKLEDVPKIIFACFILHNWCEQNNISIDDAALQQQILNDRAMQPSIQIDKRYTYTSFEGRSVRNVLKDYFAEQIS